MSALKPEAVSIRITDLKQVAHPGDAFGYKGGWERQEECDGTRPLAEL